eukprot:TRINITY_DN5066_c0_g1_i1.p1 TRINITY_DN5066_c0_g1~~TRINITY_DN5066_c0_g1_i1.p1  ORF type:complete len:372 (+),score=116.58 TRINITY_DN5066_c0_g1_i1:112-1116(+)
MPCGLLRISAAALGLIFAAGDDAADWADQQGSDLDLLSHEDDELEEDNVDLLTFLDEDSTEEEMEDLESYTAARSRLVSTDFQTADADGDGFLVGGEVEALLRNLGAPEGWDWQVFDEDADTKLSLNELEVLAEQETAFPYFIRGHDSELLESVLQYAPEDENAAFGGVALNSLDSYEIIEAEEEDYLSRDYEPEEVFFHVDELDGLDQLNGTDVTKWPDPDTQYLTNEDLKEDALLDVEEDETDKSDESEEEECEEDDGTATNATEAETGSAEQATNAKDGKKVHGYAEDGDDEEDRVQDQSEFLQKEASDSQVALFAGELAELTGDEYSQVE